MEYPVIYSRGFVFSRRRSDNLLRCFRRAPSVRLGQVIFLEDDANLQTTAWADGNLLAVAQVVHRYLETIATRTWVVVDLEGGVPGHVLIREVRIQPFERVQIILPRSRSHRRYCQPCLVSVQRKDVEEEMDQVSSEMIEEYPSISEIGDNYGMRIVRSCNNESQPNHTCSLCFSLLSLQTKVATYMYHLGRRLAQVLANGLTQHRQCRRW